MPYDIIIDEDWNRADTTVGSGANSTTGGGSPAQGHYFAPSQGGAWIDFEGNRYYHTSEDGTHKLHQAAGDSPRPPSIALYRPAVENFENGCVRIFDGQGNGGAVARFNPTNGSGYGFFFYGDQSIYVSKMSSAGGGDLVSALPITGTYPNGRINAEFAVETIAAAGGTPAFSRITLRLFAFGDDMDTATAQMTWVCDDPTPALQVSGSWGAELYGGGSMGRIITASKAEGGTLSAGTLNKLKSFKTQAHFSTTGGSGGSGNYTYQLFRSTVSNTAATPTNYGTAVTGATTTTPSDTQQTPSTTRYYRYRVTDSDGDVVWSNQVAVTYLSADTKIICFIGNSIGRGQGSTNTPAPQVMVDRLIADGYNVVFINRAVNGTGVDGFLNGGGSEGIGNVIAECLASDVDVIWSLYQTNEAAAGMPKATYKSLQKSISDAFFAAGLPRPFLNEAPWFVPNTGYAPNFNDAALALMGQYRAADAELIAAGDAKQGEAGIFAATTGHTELLADGLHLNDSGQVLLGNNGATAFEAAYPFAPSTQPTGTHDPAGDDSDDTSLRLFKRVYTRTVTRQFTRVYQRELPA